MIVLFTKAAIVILICITLIWLLSVFLKDASIVDIFWGLGFVIANGVYFFSQEVIYTRHIILLVLVTLWGVRLTVYLGYRNIGKGEDFRYQEFRRKYGPERYWWFSFFQVFLLQGTLILIVSLPLLGTNYATQTNQINWMDYVAILIWIIGFIFETVGDMQLTRFKSNPSNKGKVLNTGLWKYTRHPNYFGDSVVWWSYALLCVSSGMYWPIIGSVIMTVLIIKVSGVSLLEDTLKDKKPEYQKYIKQTSSFFPWFPKK